MSNENMKDVIGNIVRPSHGIVSEALQQQRLAEAKGTDTIEFTVKVKFSGKLTNEQIKAIKRDLPEQLASGEAGFGSGTGAFDGIDELMDGPHVKSATAKIK